MSRGLPEEPSVGIYYATVGFTPWDEVQVWETEADVLPPCKYAAND